MIRKLSHIALLLILSLSVFAQKNEELFFQILSKAETKDSLRLTSLISENQSILKSDERLTRSLAEELDSENCAYASFLMAELYPRSSWSSFYLARKAALDNDATTACNFLRSHMSQNQRRNRSAIRSCKDFNTIRDTQDWKQLWEDDAFYKEKDLQYETALDYVNNREFNWALEEINQLLGKYPDNGKYLTLRANIYLQQGQTFQAIRDIEKAIRTNSREPGYYLVAAKIYAKAEKNTKAMESLANAEQLNPYCTDLIKTQIRLYSQTGNYTTLVEKARAYTKYFRDTETMYLLADALNHTGMHTDAIILMNQVLSENTSEARYFVTRADAFKATRSWTNAMKDYAMALDIDPNQPDVYINYGMCRFENGDRDGACYLWKKALHYKHPQANDLLYRFCK